MEEIIFPKKTITTTKKTPEQSIFHFNFPLTGAVMVPPARSDKWKMPWEQYWKSTWNKQPEIASWMCHSFSPFNHELSCNSLNSPWHQTKLKVQVYFTHIQNTYIHTYIQWNAANKRLYFLKFGKIDSYCLEYIVLIGSLG